MVSDSMFMSTSFAHSPSSQTIGGLDASSAGADIPVSAQCNAFGVCRAWSSRHKASYNHTEMDHSGPNPELAQVTSKSGANIALYPHDEPPNGNTSSTTLGPQNQKISTISGRYKNTVISSYEDTGGKENISTVLDFQIDDSEFAECHQVASHVLYAKSIELSGRSIFMDIPSCTQCVIP